MSQMNFFGWIRQGVRQSVLLGVSDAVEQLGTPAATDDVHPSVAGLLHVDRKSEQAISDFSQPKAAAPNSRKRLGKSLKDLGNENS